MCSAHWFRQETGIAAEKQETALSSRRHKYHSPVTPDMVSGAEQFQRLEFLDTRGCHIQILNAKGTWSRVKLI